MRDGLLADELERRAAQYEQAAEAYRGRVGPSDYVQAERLDARADMCRELAGVYGGVRAPNLDVDDGLPDTFGELVRDGDDTRTLDVTLQRPDAPDRRLQFIRVADGWRLAEFELEDDSESNTWHHTGTADIVGVEVNGEPLDQLLGAGHATQVGPGEWR